VLHFKFELANVSKFASISPSFAEVISNTKISNLASLDAKSSALSEAMSKMNALSPRLIPLDARLSFIQLMDKSLWSRGQ
jgi:hypothetical protein